LQIKSFRWSYDDSCFEYFCFNEENPSLHILGNQLSPALFEDEDEFEKHQLLANFMQELSKKFNSDLFLEKIRRILGYGYIY
jgi:hypothetical protein